MKPSTFDSLVHNLADKRVQERISAFRHDISTACKKLYRNAPSFGAPLWAGRKDHEPSKEEKFNKGIVGFLIGRENTLPAVIWETEREAVAAELLATMDVMAQALATPPPAEDAVKPITTESETKPQ